MGYESMEKVVEEQIAATDLRGISSADEDNPCSVTSTGTVFIGDGTAVTITITVTGPPCDASLANKMRTAIATARAEITKQ